jgi:4-hydroxy-tetrahydrodipicolinate synthase
MVAALTMLDSSGRFDDSLNRDYLRYLDKGGANGVLVLGTTGEFASFSVRERKQILESSIKHKGRLDIMAMITTSNLPETLELLEHAAHAGAGSVLVLPPFYFKNPTVEGLTAFFEPVLKASRLPVYLYNIPQLSGAAITHELVDRLAAIPLLRGIKDSFSKTPEMLATMRKFPKLDFLTGVTGNIAANLTNGGGGTITGGGSYFLGETLAIFEAHRKGGDAAAAQQRYDTASRALSGYAGVPVQKFALTLKGLRESGCRPPFTPLTTQQKAELASRLKQA